MHAAVVPLTFGAQDRGDLKLRSESLTKRGHRGVVQRGVKTAEDWHHVAVTVMDAVEIIDASVQVAHARDGDDLPTLVLEHFGLCPLRGSKMPQGLKVCGVLRVGFAQDFRGRFGQTFQQVDGEEKTLKVACARVYRAGCKQA